MGEPVLSTEQTQRSLWLGDLPPWCDEGFLLGVFAGTNQLVSVKLIRNRASGISEGYAFLEFRTHEAADTILKTYNGHPIPNTDLVFRLNWAAYGVGKAQPAGEDYSLFVGDLAPDVTDMILQEYFRQFYPSVRSAKVITDAVTCRSKGYGFVRFAGEGERDRALAEMNGHFLSNRPIRVSLATARKNAPAAGLAPGGAAAIHAPHPSDYDPTNTTLFIGGLSSQVTEDQMRALFGRFGDIIYVKIPQGKGCGFVQFVLRTSADRAMGAMNGQVLGNSAIRISWGRSSSRAANHAAQLASLAGIPAAAAFGPGGAAFADPSLLAAAVAGYRPQYGGGPGLLPGDPYGGFAGVPGGPGDVFAAGGAPYGMPGMGAAFGMAGMHGMEMHNMQQQQQHSMANGKGMLPPAAAAAMAAAAAAAPPSSDPTGSEGNGSLSDKPSTELPQSSSGSEVLAALDAAGEVPVVAAAAGKAAFPAQNGKTAGVATVPPLGTQLLASLFF